MGIFYDLIKMMLKDNNIDDERTIRALKDEGEKDADKIAERLAPKEKTSFVPKVDVPPVDFEKFENGKKKEQEKQEQEK